VETVISGRRDGKIDHATVPPFHCVVVDSLQIETLRFVPIFARKGHIAGAVGVLQLLIHRHHIDRHIPKGAGAERDPGPRERAIEDGSGIQRLYH
jgi:hypothetical protein